MPRLEIDPDWAFFNEILAEARMKSANADEIQADGLDEIKSTLPPSRRISSPKGISSSKMIYPTRKGGFSYIVHQKEKPHRMVWFFFLVDDIGLEPMTFRTSSGCSSQLS